MILLNAEKHVTENVTLVFLRIHEYVSVHPDGHRPLHCGPRCTAVPANQHHLSISHLTKRYSENGHQNKFSRLAPCTLSGLVSPVPLAWGKVKRDNDRNTPGGGESWPDAKRSAVKARLLVSSVPSSYGGSSWALVSVAVIL
jgi:hypothetical protein